MPHYAKAAEWLLVGFCKSWLMDDVAVAIGIDLSDDGAFLELHEQCSFMPSSPFQYRQPVRAFIISEWPKLGAFLLRHERSPERVMSVVDQVKKLKASGKTLSNFLSEDDKKEGRKIRKASKEVSTANMAARKQQLSTQRSAWNVCKS